MYYLSTYQIRLHTGGAFTVLKFRLHQYMQSKRSAQYVKTAAVTNLISLQQFQTNFV